MVWLTFSPVYVVRLKEHLLDAMTPVWGRSKIQQRYKSLALWPFLSTDSNFFMADLNHQQMIRRSGYSLALLNQGVKRGPPV